MDYRGEKLTPRDIPGFYRGLSDYQKARKKPLLDSCMYAGESCSRPIGSHSVSRSWLEKIAEKGHVLQFRLNTEKAAKEPVRVIVERKGIGEASVFPGFCSAHDRDLFSAIENQPFTATAEQLHLLAYRSVCREACAKHQMVHAMIDQGMMEEEMTPFGVATLRQVMGSVELLSLKSILEKGIADGSFSGLKHRVVRLGRVPQVLVSTLFIPLVTATGRSLEVRADERLFLNIVPSDQGGFAIFSWLADKPKNPSLFIKALKSVTSARFTDFLLKLVVEVSDNFFISPRWWTTLGERQVELLERFARNITMGDDSPPCDLLKGKGRPLDDWRVEDQWSC